MLAAVVVSVALIGCSPVDADRSAAGKRDGSTATPTHDAARRAIVNRPAQAAGIFYDGASAATPFARRGSLVVASRTNYQGRAFKNVSRAGGTVLIYLDAVIDIPHGRYHHMLMNRSTCGPAVSRWPGSPRANQYGYLSDFRVGSVLQRKLRCVLERMVAENPHMGGWFADDIGSRSWYPGFSWSTWGSSNQRAYRAGAIALTRTFRGSPTSTA